MNEGGGRVFLGPRLRSNPLTEDGNDIREPFPYGVTDGASGTRGVDGWAGDAEGVCDGDCAGDAAWTGGGVAAGLKGLAVSVVAGAGAGVVAAVGTGTACKRLATVETAPAATMFASVGLPPGTKEAAMARILL